MRRAASRSPAMGDFRKDGIVRIQVFTLIGVIGAGPASGQTWQLTPSIAVAETLTDNVDLAPSGRQRADLVTQVTPGLRLDHTGGRLKANVNYRMSGLLYARTSGRNDIQNYLDATATAEVVSKWLFIDTRASITQQPISAFGPQTDGTSENVNANRAETLTYRISPYIRGKLASVADYEIRYSSAATAARGSNVGDTRVEDWLGTLRGVTTPMGFGWALNASHQTVHAGSGRNIETTRVNGSLIYQYSAQLRTTALVGWETNNFSASKNESAATYGARVEWMPTDRTTLLAFKERRPFSDTHEYSLRHNTPLTAWHLSDRKTITTVPDQLGLVRSGTAAELLSDALTGQFPDPVERAREVERLLQQTGVPRDLAVFTPFLTTRVLLQRARQVGVSVLGARNTVTLAATSIDSSAASTGMATIDDLSRAAEIRQHSISAAWAHRFSGYSSVNVLTSHIRSSSASGPGLESTQSLARLLYSRQLGPRTSGTVSARYVRFDSSGGSDFREKAITASLLVTF